MTILLCSKDPVVQLQLGSIGSVIVDLDGVGRAQSKLRSRRMGSGLRGRTTPESESSASPLWMRRHSTWSCSLAFLGDPFPDVGRTMEQFGPLPLPCQQKTDDVRADDGDLFEVEGGPGTAKIQLFSNLPEVLGLRGSDHADDPPSAIRPALELERHPSAAFAGETSNPRASN